MTTTTEPTPAPAVPLAVQAQIRELTDPERMKLEDQIGREAIAGRYRGKAEIELGNLAILCGDHPRSFGSGPRARHLMAEVKAGRLRAAGDLRLLKDGKKRTSLLYLQIRADDFRRYLSSHGSDRERLSEASYWCRYQSR